MQDEKKNERTADDILKQLTEMEAKASEPKPQDEPVPEPEKAEIKGDQPAEVKSEVVPDTEKVDPVKADEKPDPVVNEGEKGKELTKDEKREYTFAEMRKRLAEQEEELKQLKSSREETPTATSKVSSEPVAEKVATPKVTADEVLDVYSRAKNGNLTEDEIALIGNEEKAIALCEKILSEKIGANDLFAARQRMAATANAEAVELATKFLPVAQQRERIEADRVSAEKQSAQSKYTEELDRVQKDFPDIIAKDAPLATYATQWDKDHLTQFDPTGKILKQGKLSADMSRYLIQHPYEHAAMIKSYHDQVSAVKGTETVLKKKLALSQSAESGSPPVSKSKKEKTADELLADMERLSQGRKSAY
jgi:hypothetical protein